MTVALLLFLVSITIITSEMIEVDKFDVHKSSGHLQSVVFLYDTDLDQLLLHINAPFDIYLFLLNKEMRQSIIGYLEKGRELFENSQLKETLIQETCIKAYFMANGGWKDAGYISVTFKYRNFAFSSGETTGGVHITTDRFTSINDISINSDFPGILLYFNNIELFDKFLDCFRQDFIDGKVNSSHS